MGQNSGTEQPSWEELLGSNNWKGLLEPFDLSLRELLLKCGDMCQAAADSYITEEQSKMYPGRCRYSISALLHRTFFPYAADYDVVQYIYAIFGLTSNQKVSHWMGYIAVSSEAYAHDTGRREIYVVWRGTEGLKEFSEDIQFNPVPFDPADPDVLVMNGWYDIYTSSDPQSQFNKTSAREQLQGEIKKLVGQYKDESLSIVCAGHSLGGALAILSAFDIVKSGMSKTGDNGEFPVCAMVFDSPRVGNQAFKDRFETLPKLRALRVRNIDDWIPDLPPFSPPTLPYVDVGTVLNVDSKTSPNLKDNHDKHNLQVILHTVAGWDGNSKGGQFDPTKVKRSLALVNKHSDLLKDEYKIPASWWVEKNKGMVGGDDGEWYELPPDQA